MRLAFLITSTLFMILATIAPALAASSGTPGPSRVSCTSAGGVTDGGRSSAPGNGYAFWTALPAPLPACEEQLRVEVYDSAGAMASSGWLRSISANLNRKTTADVPSGHAMARARIEVQFTNNPGSRLCKVFFPTLGDYHSCTNIHQVHHLR